MNYEVITIEDLKNYLESSHYMMDIKLLSHCKRLGIVKSVKEQIQALCLIDC